MKFTTVKLPSNRKFGMFFTLVFLVIGIYLNDKASILVITSIYIFASLLIILTLIKPEILTPVNKMWMYFGFLIGRVLNPTIMIIIFYGIITPMSIFLKTIGRDELRMKASKRHSFWTYRNTKDYPKSSFKQQF